jgi:hypothetical protein
MKSKLIRSVILCALIVLSVAPGVLLAEEMSMTVAIKPGSDVAPFNMRSRGVTPVAILGDDSIDVRDIDPVTIACTGADFGDGTPVTFDPAIKPVRSSYEDLDGNGNEDINLKFKTQSIQDALLNHGSLTNGQTVTLFFSAVSRSEVDTFEGSDTILIKLKKQKEPK